MLTLPKPTTVAVREFKTVAQKHVLAITRVRADKWNGKRVHIRFSDLFWVNRPSEAWYQYNLDTGNHSALSLRCDLQGYVYAATPYKAVPGHAFLNYDFRSYNSNTADANIYVGGWIGGDALFEDIAVIRDYVFENTAKSTQLATNLAKEALPHSYGLLITLLSREATLLRETVKKASPT